MLYYHEVVVHTDGRDQVLRRLPTHRDAEDYIAEMTRADIFSRKVIRAERRRGVHPWTAAGICGALTLLTPLVPFMWLSLFLLMTLLAFMMGFLTSGNQWIAGGRDDR